MPFADPDLNNYVRRRGDCLMTVTAFSWLSTNRNPDELAAMLIRMDGKVARRIGRDWRPRVLERTAARTTILSPGLFDAKELAVRRIHVVLRRGTKSRYATLEGILHDRPATLKGDLYEPCMSADTPMIEEMNAIVDELARTITYRPAPKPAS